MNRPKILIIEDNTDMRAFLEGFLSREFDTISAENGIIGLELARTQTPDLILLDIMLPILHGYDVCNLLQKDERTNRIPILMLSAKGGPSNITQGLSKGADDYLSKPFDNKELVARIKARLKRTQIQVQQALVIGELKIDAAEREVTYHGKQIRLTLTEFDLLRYLASKAGTVVSRDELIKEIWGTGRDHSGDTNDRTIDVHIRALRKKIPSLTKHIISIYGVGYKYEP